jgi:geranylgeranyl diphosphate synthase type I
MSLREAFDRFLPQIEDDLKEVVRAPQHSLATYYGMMRYHLGWADEALQPVQSNSGKRLRPMLCLLACEAAGGDPQQALPAASAVELVHSFSLVHDDIQDGSPVRRGRRAVWDIWGSAHGINVGDGLFVLTRLALHRLADRGVPLPRRQAAALTLDRACLALCEGQFFDMSFEDRLDVELDEYLWMIQHKTAALLAASAQLGAIVASDDAEQIDRCHSFGENLGMAFQIQDDILGAWGKEQVTGKSAATDIRDKKKTLPVVYALNQQENRVVARQLADLYRENGPLDTSAIQQALAILDRVGARQYAEAVAAEYYRQALESLAQIGPGETQPGKTQPGRTRGEEAAQSQLRELAASLLGRTA